MADEQIDVQQLIYYVFRDWREIIFDAKWLFLVAFYPLYFPFLATGSAGARGNGLLAVQDGWQEAFCFRLPRRRLMRWLL